MPLGAFLSDVEKSFEPAQGAKSKRNRVFAALRKIQLALSTVKKVKGLRQRIAVPMSAVGIMLGQQIV